MTLTQTKSIGCSVLVGLAAALLGGCAKPDSLSYDNYTQVRTSVSTQDDVLAALGEPTNRLPDMWIYERPDKHLTVMIDFDDKGKVSRTQWIDALGETWHDTSDKK